jgi:hypothetical protein
MVKHGQKSKSKVICVTTGRVTRVLYVQKNMMCQQYDDMVGNMWMDYKLTRGTFEKAKLAWNQNGWSWNVDGRN